MGLNGHMSIRHFTLTSCQKCSYLHIKRPIIEKIKISNSRGAVSTHVIKILHNLTPLLVYFPLSLPLFPDTFSKVLGIGYLFYWLIIIYILKSIMLRVRFLKVFFKKLPTQRPWISVTCIGGIIFSYHEHSLLQWLIFMLWRLLTIQWYVCRLWSLTSPRSDYLS